MASDSSFNTTNLKLSVLKRVVIGGLVLFAGGMGMMGLASLRKPPAEAKNGERPIYVEVARAMPEDIPVSITGYGEMKALNVVVISPEVPGKILALHPRLETGEVIGESELLFGVDPSNYIAARNESRAAVSQLTNAVERVKKQFEIDTERLKTIERNRNLAETEYQRIRALFEVDSVGTQSGVDRAEQALNNTSDQADLMVQAVSLYPIRIKEAEGGLASAQARLSLAEANLRRCEVRAPFDGRIKAVSLEKGQYVSPGQQVLTLADDSMLEIHVPLDSRDARRWLRFDDPGDRRQSAWFSGLIPMPCKIRWTEMGDDVSWEGRLHRVVKFDPQTRTVTVAIRVQARNASMRNNGSLPLVEGMFCSVSIPGKVLEQVIPLPRWSVSFDSTVYVARDNRLKTLPVSIARSEGDYAYIDGGLEPGDLVITTRLIDPLENALLDVAGGDDRKGES